MSAPVADRLVTCRVQVDRFRADGEQARARPDALYRTLSGLEDGTVEPTRATAIAAVERAIVTTFETAQIDARLAEIERQVSERAA